MFGLIRISNEKSKLVQPHAYHTLVWILYITYQSTPLHCVSLNVNYFLWTKFAQWFLYLFTNSYTGFIERPFELYEVIIECLLNISLPDLLEQITNRHVVFTMSNLLKWFTWLWYGIMCMGPSLCLHWLRNKSNGRFRIFGSLWQHDRRSN